MVINWDKHEWEQDVGEDDEGHAVAECLRCNVSYCEICDTADPLPLCDKDLVMIHLRLLGIKGLVDDALLWVAGKSKT